MGKKTGLFLLFLAVLTQPKVGFSQQQVHWEATLQNAQRRAGETNRLVLIQFWAPWCVVCKQMEANVLTQPSVIAELDANYVPVRINADHFPATARQYGVTALPTTAIISPQGQLLDSMRGRMEIGQYAARLNQVAVAQKQRDAATQPSVPASVAAPLANQPAPSQALAGSTPVADLRPHAVESQAPADAASAPIAASPSPPQDRYADFFNRNRADTAPMHAQSQPPIASPSNVGPSAPPIAAPGTSPAPPPNVQPANPPAGNPPVANPSVQAPALNSTLIMNGYCPVSLCEKQQWVLGDRRWGAIHRGRTYLFAGPEEQRRFFTDPDRYAPVVSGNDIVLASEQGQAVPGVREHGVFFGGRIYLFSSEASLEKFARNPDVYTNQALEAIRAGNHSGRQLR